MMDRFLTPCRFHASLVGRYETDRSQRAPLVGGIFKCWIFFKGVRLVEGISLPAVPRTKKIHAEKVMRVQTASIWTSGYAEATKSD